MEQQLGLFEDGIPKRIRPYAGTFVLPGEPVAKVSYSHKCPICEENATEHSIGVFVHKEDQMDHVYRLCDDRLVQL